MFENNNYKKIIIHEKIHSSQFHTIDVIFFELLAALTWFNPLVWKMRNSIFLIHEYLADEGVLRTGIDRLKYQALLVNQITEERLICISSSFNHSLIKKRMIMMTKSKFNQQSKVRIWSLIPVTLMLLIVVACAKQTPQKEVEKLCIEEVQEGIKIYIVDGERVETINDIDPELIHSVDVNKKENTITVITKAYQKANFETVENLVILNGKEQGQNFDIASIDQNAIKSINVIKDKEQMKAYTSKNYDGILIIDTK